MPEHAEAAQDFLDRAERTMGPTEGLYAAAQVHALLAIADAVRDNDPLDFGWSHDEDGNVYNREGEYVLHSPELAIAAEKAELLSE